MHIHILGICGTFMGSLALLARGLGMQVSGCDEQVYPPMSTQLQKQGIALHEGYQAESIPDDADMIVIGNALSRGNPAVEAVLNSGRAYLSGPEWLARHVLPGRWVLAIAGTHGKTTSSSMLAWILEYGGLSPGFLIGGVPRNFGVSARLGDTPFFVIEADEYDTAFFDKRSKFIHYRPRTLAIGNLEFDHADIFSDLKDIQRQFHHLLRTVPSDGRIIYSSDSPALEEVLAAGCWSESETFSLSGEGAEWAVADASPDGSSFCITFAGKKVGEVRWPLSGRHNMANALVAVAAARHAGIPPGLAAEALQQFRNVARRLERLDAIDGVVVYDDFAHHPTAIASTLQGLRAKIGGEKLITVIEPRSNTMRQGVHQQTLLEATREADHVIWFNGADLPWLEALVEQAGECHQLFSETSRVVDQVLALTSQGGGHVVIMSNGGFEGIHGKLIASLKDRQGRVHDAV